MNLQSPSLPEVALRIGGAVVAALLQRRRVLRAVVRVGVVEPGLAQRRAVGPGGYGLLEQ